MINEEPMPEPVDALAAAIHESGGGTWTFAKNEAADLYAVLKISGWDLVEAANLAQEHAKMKPLLPLSAEAGDTP
jgi:hypothetical protein